MSNQKQKWCNTDYIKPRSVDRFAVIESSPFSQKLCQLLLKHKVYLAGYNYNNPENGNKVFDCLLDYVEDHVIPELKEGSAILIFDMSFEGCWQDFSMDTAVHNSIKKYQIPPESICLLMGTSTPARYSDVNSVYFPALIRLTVRNDLDMLQPDFSRRQTLPKTHNGFYFSALSYKYRYWRSWAIYNLLHSDLKQKSLLSNVEKPNTTWHSSNPEQLDQDIIDYFLENAPLVTVYEQDCLKDSALDSGDFHHTIINKINRQVYQNTLFHVTLETYQDTGVIFYTEKTFKAMLSELPLLIWGAPGMNTVELENHGFRTYSDWFDLSFDTEPDPKQRWRLLQQEIHRVANMLDDMSVSERIEWSVGNQTVIDHNKQNLISLMGAGYQQLANVLESYFS